MLRRIIRYILCVGEFAITGVWYAGMGVVGMYVNNYCVGNQFLINGA